MSNSDIESYLKSLDNESKSIKDEIFRISWFMRGGVSSYDLFHVYSVEDRDIMNKIIKENIENTKNTKLPLM
jgi:hypothetical protein